ncbi:hypothetical protein CYMTET_27598, partial [Cymbomonas tetramitiformis]
DNAQATCILAQEAGLSNERHARHGGAQTFASTGVNKIMTKHNLLNFTFADALAGTAFTHVLCLIALSGFSPYAESIMRWTAPIVPATHHLLLDS